MKKEPEARASATTDDRFHLDLPERPIIHWSRPIVALLVLLLVVFVVLLFWRAKINYASVPKYFMAPLMLEGVWNAIKLALLAQTLAIVVGSILAVMRLSKNAVNRHIASLYVWFWRAVPVLVSLLIWFNLALVLQRIQIPDPFSGGYLIDLNTNDVLTPFVAALIALTLNESAYMAEIIRAGILGVDSGQIEAARALGMNDRTILRRATLPQATRLIIPPTSNELINMIKETSLVSVISYIEITEAANRLSAANLDIIPALFAAVVWYLILVTIATFFQRWVEDRVSHSNSRPRGGRRLFRTLLGSWNPLTLAKR
ncbi:amino acid ABC transporter permease [Castellaniella sp.]|uniref:amino acid ABC transporter permease n=1 Tax=Castellaniella sp. TaxID=1955812 RepID=UPI00356317D3